MGLIAGRHCFAQMGILQLDDLIRGVSAQRVIARSAQLLARHCLHNPHALSVGSTVIHDEPVARHRPTKR
jgi:hypothetical protein